MKAAPRGTGAPGFLPPSGTPQPFILRTAELGGSFILAPQGSRVGWQSHTAPRKVAIPFACGCCYQKKRAWSIQQDFPLSWDLQVPQFRAPFAGAHFPGPALAGQPLRNEGWLFSRGMSPSRH